MDCPRWNDEWIAVLYDELDEPAADEARRHLATCADCRATLERLETSRTLLRRSAPLVPFSPRVVVLERRRLHPAWAFAGGLAAAAALFAVALAVIPSRQPADAASPALEARLASLEQQNAAPRTDARPEVEARLARLEQQSAELLESARSGLTRDELQQQMQEALRRVNVERTKDFEFLLGEIAATEWRTNNQIRNNNDALLQTMLAGNPRFSEQ